MNNKQPAILITGADGQLGNELRVLAPSFPAYTFLFVGKQDLDITDPAAIENYFSAHAIHYCINCAAYTAVDKAETDRAAAFLINTEAVAILAKACKTNDAQLIHISTDYVFDGTATGPYIETDNTNPVSVYGHSKLEGEKEAMQHCPSTIIIRTAWVYSSFKNNFVKTMLRLMNERSSISVVSDQVGCPTYAADLAMAIMQIIDSRKSLENPGIYHYSNAGITNWYDFAIAIQKLSGIHCTVSPITTDQYPTTANRPAYSVLDTSKIKDVFGVTIPAWKESLESCLDLLK